MPSSQPTSPFLNEFLRIRCSAMIARLCFLSRTILPLFWPREYVFSASSRILSTCHTIFSLGFQGFDSFSSVSVFVDKSGRMKCGRNRGCLGLPAKMPLFGGSALSSKSRSDATFGMKVILCFTPPKFPLFWLKGGGRFFWFRSILVNICTISLTRCSTSPIAAALNSWLCSLYVDNASASLGSRLTLMTQPNFSCRVWTNVIRKS